MGKVVEFTRVPGSQTSKPNADGGAAKPLWRHAVGEVLRVERLGQERILTEVAAAAGVSPQYLSEIERGRKEPSSEVLGSVAEALELDLVDIVQRVGTLLGERRERERRTAEHRELLRIETSFAFRAGELAPFDVDAQHALAALPDAAFGDAATNAYLLAA
ncbi:helix-turn-helix domain-containing protein [Agromyces sp. Root1464]|uniref:helix-turn-helix domain-containing protein n=1 Tax=Agromyces sp. Root1464 TaxID=1736467 RepID=UPI0009EC8E05|nr:helix-turn-helix transcriptional regulator [Agromyces sp. Root1464]